MVFVLVYLRILDGDLLSIFNHFFSFHHSLEYFWFLKNILMFKELQNLLNKWKSNREVLKEFYKFQMEKWLELRLKKLIQQQTDTILINSLWFNLKIHHLFNNLKRWIRIKKLYIKFLKKNIRIIIQQKHNQLKKTRRDKRIKISH